MTRRWHRRPKAQLLTIGALLSVGVLAAELANARPGGGHSYSGSRSSSSGSSSRSYGGSSSRSYGGSPSSYGGSSSPSSDSGSGSSGGSVDSFGCSMFGTMVIAGVAMLAVAINTASSKESWDSAADSFDDAPPPPPPPKPIRWDKLRALDPDFSQVCFEDFAFRLYASMHEARGDQSAMDALAPYAAPKVREAFMRRDPVGARISNVVIGSMRVSKLKIRPERVELTLTFESNVTAEDAQATWYLLEEWELVRNADVRSRPPEAVRALKCPNCGAPFVSADDQRCDYCNEVVDDGRFDWYIRRSRLRQAEQTPPTLGGYAPEVGTDLRTLTSPSIFADLRALQADDPAFSLDAIGERIDMIFERMNLGWTARDLSIARPFLSEGIYDYLRYWIVAYRRQELINCLEETELDNVEFVKLTRDRWFDALTVRVHASGLDYTIRELDDELVGGSKTRRRRYTEYWTLIRGADVRGAPGTEPSCPNCAAPLSVTMAGNCEHCSAHLTRGEFDWVLSKIEQDESYRG